MGEWIERFRLPIGLVLTVALVVGVAVTLARRPETRPIEIITPTRVPKVSQTLKVYVTGEVASPGVYTLSEGDRIEDALRAAGGAIPDADLNRVNLAVRVQDQMQIYVPKKPGEGGPPHDISQSASPSRININTATATELDSLPEVGPVTAQRILAYRQQNGLFKSVEELKEAKLVNNSTFEKIKDLITAP